MKAAISRFLKWVINISFFILGFYCLTTAMEENTIRPMIFVLLCFGVVLWTSKAVYKGSQKVIIVTALVLLVAALAARYAVWGILLANDVFIGFYPVWELCVLALGAPVMTRVFLKEK